MDRTKKNEASWIVFESKKIYINAKYRSEKCVVGSEKNLTCGIAFVREKIENDGIKKCADKIYKEVVS